MMDQWPPKMESDKGYLPTATKICPMMSDVTTPVECIKTKCAWWDGKWGRCSIFSIACKR